MNQIHKIIIPVVITAVIIVGGVYYWQNSKTPPQVPSVEESSGVSGRLPLSDEFTGQQTKENANKTINWKTYSNLGVSIMYPNDGTYVVDEKGPNPSSEGFTISQKHSGNRIHIYKTNDLSMLSDNAQTKVINGRTYKIFHRDGVGSGYGYAIEYNGQFYIFESVWGSENEVFELMMTTVEFK
jgi:hypothetical protein